MLEMSPTPLSENSRKLSQRRPNYIEVKRLQVSLIIELLATGDGGRVRNMAHHEACPNEPGNAPILRGRHRLTPEGPLTHGLQHFQPLPFGYGALNCNHDNNALTLTMRIFNRNKK
ncbi:hypothetical protein KBB27_04380, partial [Patescibacteria group bacterium]|nr:hypothetical protein [Patescibacteria group bacterium]